MKKITHRSTRFVNKTQRYVYCKWSDNKVTRFLVSILTDENGDYEEIGFDEEVELVPSNIKWYEVRKA